FIKCYNPDNRHQRSETERFKKFTYDEVVTRDKTNLDIFWLKDESITDLDNLPNPEVIAAEIVDNLEGALESFKIVQEALTLSVGHEDSKAESKPKPFDIMLAVGGILERGFTRGEMVTAKLLYLAQEIFGAPLGISFSKQNFGPYDPKIKKALGAAKKQQYLTLKKVGEQEVCWAIGGF
ncbi:transcriptional regulator, Fis family, partial [candidate division TM7 genomosp. GTL1]